MVDEGKQHRKNTSGKHTECDHVKRKAAKQNPLSI
jgi:hypothetical protein